MSQPLEVLLQPSLTGRKLTKPMYSVGSHIFVAFFGGPVGLFFYSLNSARYSKVLHRWWGFYLLFLVIAFASQFYIGVLSVEGMPGWIPLETNSSGSLKLINRVIALILMGILYLLQKQLFNISQLKGDLPSPWVPGIISCVIGVIATVFIVTGVSVNA